MGNQIKFRIDPEFIENYRRVCDHLDIVFERLARKLAACNKMVIDEEMERRRRLLKLDIVFERLARKLAARNKMVTDEEMERRRRLLKRCASRFNRNGGFRGR